MNRYYTPPQKCIGIFSHLLQTRIGYCARFIPSDCHWKPIVFHIILRQPNIHEWNGMNWVVSKSRSRLLFTYYTTLLEKHMQKALPTINIIQSEAIKWNFQGLNRYISLNKSKLLYYRACQAKKVMEAGIQLFSKKQLRIYILKNA